MELLSKNAKIYLPQNKKEGNCKYMAIGAHQDDLEIMAIDGIIKAFHAKNESFVGVVTTNGSGSARDGIYKNHTNEQIKKVRAKEQEKAAEIGRYHALISLNYSSKELKDVTNENIIKDYIALLKQFKPEIIYTHNICDKHDSHVAVVVNLINAIRKMDKEDKPKKIYGCEVWRNLDWLNDDEKTVFDVSTNQKLSVSLLKVFDSQISGGKRYDLATIGRRIANATYFASHQVDEATHLAFAMDLTELCYNTQLSIINFASKKIDNFKLDVISKIKRFTK